jgi:PAS domain S-box-containing protein
VSHPLKVLIVEDSEQDALLLSLELERAGYEVSYERVETPEAMREALQRDNWQVVVADYVMPHFNGLAALALVKELGLDLPFIIVSGHITDDTAVAAMKAGAHDYVMKENLARLGPAVQRELREAEVRRERRKTEDRLKVESAFREAVENSVPAGISAVDLEGRQTYVNPALCRMLGWSEKELLKAQPPYVYWPPEEIDNITHALSDVISGTAPSGGLELRFRRRNQERLDVLLLVTPLRDNFGNVSGWVSSVSDITERKRAEVRLAAEHAITRILANAQTLDEAAPGILQVLLDGLEMEIAALWIVEPKTNTLHVSRLTTRSLSVELKNFADHTRRLILSPGDSLPGQVWQQRRPLWLEDISTAPGFTRLDAAEPAGLRSYIAFPVQNAGDFFGVFELFASRSLEPNHTILNMTTAIGSEIAQFIQRRSAEEALRRARDELEVRVQQRTAELKTANTRLEAAINERKRLENELLEITEKERRRIGLDLHDDLGQRLSGIALMTKGLELKLTRQQAPEAQEAARIHILVHEAMNHASDLAHELATLDLTEKDLPTALKDLAAHATELFGITCRFSSQGDIPSLESEAVKQLYKITQEAVTNSIKHGKAKKVEIQLSRDDHSLLLQIQNNGVPFPDLKAHAHTGMGLRIMTYRASLINAQLDVKGLGTRGTLVTCTMPLEAHK